MNPKYVAVLMLTLAAVGTMPAQASISETTPVIAVCVLANTDSCTDTWSTGLVGVYALGATGVFQGTIKMTATSHANPAIAWSQTCTGIIAGILVTQGGCTQSGTFPFGLIDIACSSVGTGAVTCSIEGQ